MNVTSPTTTPSRAVHVESPVQWMRAFDYTPDSHSARARSSDRHPELAEEDRRRVALSDEDALPTRFHSCAAVTVNHRVPNPGRDPMRGGDLDDSEACVSDPCLTVPAKRKRQSGGRGGLSSDSLASITDGVSVMLGSPSSRKTRSRTRCTFTSGGSGHGRGLGPSRAPLPSTRPRSRRVVLDAVEIVRKGRPHWDRMADLGTVRAGYPTDSARKMASSHYPSPPASRAPRDVAVRDSHSSAHAPHANTAEREERASPEPTLPLKTSKYFAPAPAPTTRSVPENFPAPTPHSSPMLTIPVYIESSDFEYPPLDISFDEPVEDLVNESGHIPTWYDSPSLFDDLMIMLRRLKPILVQGGLVRLHYCFRHE